MATDLDRAYIINGDDLRIALKDHVVPNPEDVARNILGYVAKPLDESRWPMTRGELLTRLSFALEHTPVLIHGNHLKSVDGEEDDWFRVLAAAPGAFADELVDDIGRQGTDRVVGGTRLCCNSYPVDVHQALCPETGKPLPAPPDWVIDSDDPEIQAIALIHEVLGCLDPAARRRALEYHLDRATT